MRGPRPGQIGDDLDAVRAWVAALDAARRGDAHYSLRFSKVGGRLIGRNELPARAVVESYQQTWSLLGVTEQVRTYSRILALVAEEPAARDWVAAQPLRALEVADAWPALLAAYRWLRQSRGSGQYLREITAPGVDTKFVERHRGVLAQMLNVPQASAGFMAALGLRAKPEMVRLRFDPLLDVATGLSEVVVRVDELSSLPLTVKTAVIVENEITYLSVPVPVGGLVIWGKGFEVQRLGSLPWLAHADISYWGDLDTYGFAILHQLRAVLPQTRSILMDRDTLLAHRDRWVSESAPTAARLNHLTDEEQALYQDLVTDRFGVRVRLEQERIDWSWVRDRFRLLV